MRVFDLLKTRIEKMEEKRDVKGLILALKDEDELIRQESARALGKIGSTEAIEPLTQALQDPDKGVKEEAITALGKIGDPKATPPLINALNSQYISIRWNAAQALGKIGSTEAIEPLTQALQDPDKGVKEEAITALGRITIKPLLKDLQSNESGVKKEALLKINNAQDLKTSQIIKNISKSKSSPKPSQGNDGTPQKETEKIAIEKKTLKVANENKEKETTMAGKRSINLKVEGEKTEGKIHQEDTAFKINSESADFKDRQTKLNIKGYYQFIEKFVSQSKIDYLENFVRKSRYDYQLSNLHKLKVLLEYKGIKFQDEEILWLIQQEIKKQQYHDFKEKIMENQPTTLKQYLENYIKNYPQNTAENLENLKKLLQKQQTPTYNLEKQIKETQQQKEIQEFENKLLKEQDHTYESIPVIESNVSKDKALKNAQILYNMGNLYYDLGKPDEAVRYYEEAIYTYPKYIEAWKNKGLIYYTMGKPQKAAACYNHVLTLDPEYGEVWLDIGVVLFEMGKLREAKLCYDKAIQMGSGNIEDTSLYSRQFLHKNPFYMNIFDKFLDSVSSEELFEEYSHSLSPISQIMQFLMDLNQ